ncbi:dihydrodipicolinate reductase [Rhodococcus olei]|uniref:Dihydrodipicolinate reductase n=1 Tax=Rhodococcus olei TaxID=2161675 RepID=A0ABP8PQT0_9NOCA
MWGDGSIAADAIRAVDSHPGLDLTAVLVSGPDRAGRDAGDLAGLGRRLGVVATTDVAAVLAARPRAVVYAGSGTTRSADARADVVAALRVGAVVATPPIHPLHDHGAAVAEIRAEIRTAIAEGGGTLYVCDVDPDWTNHVLPLLLRGLDAGATSVHCREIVDYSGYDLPGSVRYLMGMGEPLDYLPPMLAPRMPSAVWGDRVRLLARALGVELDEIRETLQRLELEVTVETETMGKFEAGGQGAVRFEVRGLVGGQPRVVVEHVGRIHPDCAPDWPTVPAGGVAHRVVVEGDPRVEVTIEPGLRDGAGSAVDRLVEAIEWLTTREPGLYDALDVARRDPAAPEMS